MLEIYGDKEESSVCISGSAEFIIIELADAVFKVGECFDDDEKIESDSLGYTVIKDAFSYALAEYFTKKVLAETGEIEVTQEQVNGTFNYIAETLKNGINNILNEMATGLEED